MVRYEKPWWEVLLLPTRPLRQPREKPGRIRVAAGLGRDRGPQEVPSGDKYVLKKYNGAPLTVGARNPPMSLESLIYSTKQI